jgi:hypothetical protein
MKRIAVLLALLAFTSIAHAQTAIIGAPNRTPIDCSGSIATGGTAQNLLDATKTDLHGFCLLNIDTSENLWLSLNGTAAASTAGSYSLAPASSTAQGGSFCTPPGMGVKTNPTVVAASTSHKYSCTWW